MRFSAFAVAASCAVLVAGLSLGFSSKPARAARESAGTSNVVVLDAGFVAKPNGACGLSRLRATGALGPTGAVGPTGSETLGFTNDGAKEFTAITQAEYCGFGPTGASGPTGAVGPTGAR